jgi:hypothetical protein
MKGGNEDSPPPAPPKSHPPAQSRSDRYKSSHSKEDNERDDKEKQEGNKSAGVNRKIQFPLEDGSEPPDDPPKSDPHPEGRYVLFKSKKQKQKEKEDKEHLEREKAAALDEDMFETAVRERKRHDVLARRVFMLSKVFFFSLLALYFLAPMLPPSPPVKTSRPCQTHFKIWSTYSIAVSFPKEVYPTKLHQLVDLHPHTTAPGGFSRVVAFHSHIVIDDSDDNDDQSAV